MLFQYTKAKFSVKDSAYEGRLSVSGDPSVHSVNVTISQLRATDTDRFSCEFMVEKVASEDERIPGRIEFFLLVNSGEFYVLFSLPHTRYMLVPNGKFCIFPTEQVNSNLRHTCQLDSN